MPSGALFRATFLVGQFAGVWADGWYYSSTGMESCAEKCMAEGGTCDDITAAPKHKEIDGGSILTLAAEMGVTWECSGMSWECPRCYWPSICEGALRGADPSIL
jgi:hypothetical protein